MSRVILLDAGPLGIVSNPRFSSQTLDCHPGLPSAVSANPWLEVHGSLSDDPTFDDFMTEISNYQ